MNWKQFKEAVEKQGVKDEDKLRYIDTSFGYPIDASKDEKGEWMIT